MRQPSGGNDNIMSELPTPTRPRRRCARRAAAAQTSPRTSPRTRRNRCLLREIPRELVRVAAAALHPLDASVLAVASKWLKAAAWDGLKSQERFVWSEAVERRYGVLYRSQTAESFDFDGLRLTLRRHKRFAALLGDRDNDDQFYFAHDGAPDGRWLNPDDFSLADARDLPLSASPVRDEDVVFLVGVYDWTCEEWWGLWHAGDVDHGPEGIDLRFTTPPLEIDDLEARVTFVCAVVGGAGPDYFVFLSQITIEGPWEALPRFPGHPPTERAKCVGVGAYRTLELTLGTQRWGLEMDAPWCKRVLVKQDGDGADDDESDSYYTFRFILDFRSFPIDPDDFYPDGPSVRELLLSVLSGFPPVPTPAPGVVSLERFWNGR